MHETLERMIEECGFGNRFRQWEPVEQAKFLAGFGAAAWYFATWHNGEQICGISTRWRELGEMLDNAATEIVEKDRAARS